MRKKIIDFICKCIFTQPVKSLQDVWNWLDGKKTNIGAGLLVIGGFLQVFNDEFLVNIWHCAAIPHLAQVIASIDWWAEIFGGTGLVHKYAKFKTANPIKEIPAEAGK